MKKKTAWIMIGILFLIWLGVTFFLVVGGKGKDNSSYITVGNRVEVKAGKLIFNDWEQEGAIRNEFPMIVQEDGFYNIRIKLTVNGTKDPSFATAIALIASNGEVVCDTSGGEFDSEMDTIELKAGEYNLVAVHCANQEQMDEFHREIGRNYNRPYAYFGSDCDCEVSWKVSMTDINGHLQSNLILVIALFLGLIIGAVLLLATHSGDLAMGTYDERQILARGYAFQVSFFLLLFLCLIMIIAIENMEFLPATPSACLMLVVGVVATCFACICIWKDAYLSINERKPFTIGVLVFITILNAAIGISSLRSGEAFEYGKLTIRGTNLVFAIAMLIVLINYTVKSLIDKKEMDDEESEA